MTKLSVWTALTLIAAVAAAWLWYVKRPLPDAIQRKWIPTISLNQIQSRAPFSATVDSVNYGFRDPASNGLFAYVLILVKTSDGEEKGLSQSHPDSNVLAFVKSLVVGQTYEFPTILTTLK